MIHKIPWLREVSSLFVWETFLFEEMERSAKARRKNIPTEKFNSI